MYSKNFTHKMIGNRHNGLNEAIKVITFLGQLYPEVLVFYTSYPALLFTYIIKRY